MTRREAQEILAVIMILYPNSYTKFSEDEMSLAIDSWALVLEGFEFKSINAALKKFAQTNSSGYPPTPGQLIELTVPKFTEWADVMLEISKASDNAYYHAREEFDNLSPLAKLAIETPKDLRYISEMRKDDALRFLSDTIRPKYKNELKTRVDQYKQTGDISYLPMITSPLMELDLNNAGSLTLEQKQNEIKERRSICQEN